MFTPEQEKKIQEIINASTKTTFSKRIGDTPTDALQLVNKKYVDNQIAGLMYVGYVASSGDPVSLPTGWSSVRNATGDYTVTHNLGLGANGYSVVGNIASSDTRAVSFTIATNSFGIHVGNAGNTGLADYSVMFILGIFTT